MSDSGRDTLRRVFELGYDDLRIRLVNRTGSSEIANDALHETWLRINRAAPSGPVHSPKGYIFRIAMNVVLQRWQVENRFATLSDAKMAIGIAENIRIKMRQKSTTSTSAHSFLKLAESSSLKTGSGVVIKTASACLKHSSRESSTTILLLSSSRGMSFDIGS